MGIITDLWGKFTNSNELENTIYDEAHRLIDLTNILNITLTELKSISQENNQKYIEKIEIISKNIDNQRKDKTKNGKEATKQRKLLFQCQTIIATQNILEAYIQKYEERLNKSDFLDERQNPIDFLKYFSLQENFTLEELNNARSQKENEAYLLNGPEKNKEINFINNAYAILNDPIRKKGYLDILKEFQKNKENKNEEMNTSQTTKENHNNLEVLEVTPEVPSSIETLEELSVTELPKTSSQIDELESLESDPDFEIFTLPEDEREKNQTTNNIQQINHLEEDLPPKAPQPIIDQPQLTYISVSNLQHQTTIKKASLTKTSQQVDLVAKDTIDYMPIANNKSRIIKLKEQKRLIEIQTIPNLNALYNSIEENKRKLKEHKDFQTEQKINLTYLIIENLIAQNKKLLYANPTYVQIINVLNELNTSNLIYLDETKESKKIS